MNKLDVASAKTIENGVIVPPGLQVNEMTLREHQDYLTWISLKRRLNREEAIVVGHRPAEIDAYFGPLVEEVKPVAIAAPVPKIIDHEAILKPAQSTRMEHGKATWADRTIARGRGFTGDICVTCGGAQMIRAGTCLTCVSCGSTSGCG